MAKILRLLAPGIVLLGGCASGVTFPDPPQAPPTTTSATSWSTASYRYTITSSCGERAMLGTYHLTVEDGRITQIEPADPNVQLIDWYEGDLPTIADLLSRAQAGGDGAPSELVVDPSTGVPTRVAFDGDPNAIDDEECYTITDYRPGVGPGE
ncbi:hypothetical protein IC607_10400 [Cellulomonas sp. JH27-2]|uniref:DUF6174 domain-containing protein n=1 Tax=Cellulomonas sp. JH27-2 TaxID=2774139 RepID=UPI001780A6E1|nr:DUF6174 domain-containing protein [Cellulomonas sp. JH27-2]MBD8059377.1 hypothetical protein [Cellulomonas sp. JH27-2]